MLLINMQNNKSVVSVHVSSIIVEQLLYQTDLESCLIFGQVDMLSVKSFLECS